MCFPTGGFDSEKKNRDFFQSEINLAEDWNGFGKVRIWSQSPRVLIQSSSLTGYGIPRREVDWKTFLLLWTWWKPCQFTLAGDGIQCFESLLPVLLWDCFPCSSRKGFKEKKKPKNQTTEQPLFSWLWQGGCAGCFPCGSLQGMCWWEVGWAFHSNDQLKSVCVYVIWICGWVLLRQNRFPFSTSPNFRSDLFYPSCHICLGGVTPQPAVWS